MHSIDLKLILIEKSPTFKHREISDISLFLLPKTKISHDRSRSTSIPIGATLIKVDVFVYETQQFFSGRLFLFSSALAVLSYIQGFELRIVTRSSSTRLVSSGQYS